MEIYKVLLGPLVTAQMVNKTLFNIYERFEYYFNVAIDNEYNIMLGDFQRKLQGDALMAKIRHMDRSKIAVREEMTAVMASDRRLYAMTVYNHRSKFEGTVQKQKEWTAVKVLKAVYELFQGKLDIIGTLRDYVVVMRMQIMEICDQSIVGYHALIDAFYYDCQDAGMPRINFGMVFEVKADDHDWTTTEKYQVVDKIEDIKSYIQTEFFLMNLQDRRKILIARERAQEKEREEARMVGRKTDHLQQLETGSLAKFTIEMLDKLQHEQRMKKSIPETDIKLFFARYEYTVDNYFQYTQSASTKH